MSSTSATTHKALFLDQKVGDLSVSQIDIYKPGAGEVLISVQSASLNPLDWKNRKFGFLLEAFPAILGVDIAGYIAEVGEGVTELKAGDRVYVQVLVTNLLI